MSDEPADAPAHSSTAGGVPPSVELCVLLACFAGARGAAKVRRQVRSLVEEWRRRDPGRSGPQGHRHAAARTVHDPYRTRAGLLTPALTWGVFGLLAGGWSSAALWAVCGAVCGYVFAYYFEHQLTKTELRRIGGQLPPDSSALLTFSRGTDPQGQLSAIAVCQPTMASVAEISSDLKANLYIHPAVDPARMTQQGEPAAPVLSMILLRYAGERGARHALETAKAGASKAHDVPDIELLIETNQTGGRRVINPTTGSRALAIPDALTWGAFGLVWGAVVGFTAGDHGVLGPLKNGLITGVLWTLFGLGAGALYGLWAGRGVSARRLKGLDPLLPRDTSAVVAWADGDVTHQSIDRLAAAGTARLILQFQPVRDGAVLST